MNLNLMDPKLIAVVVAVVLIIVVAVALYIRKRNRKHGRAARPVWARVRLGCSEIRV